MKNLILIIGMICSMGSSAKAIEGNEGGGGGNEAALQFIEAAKSAVAITRDQQPDLHRILQQRNIGALLQNMQVLVVNTPLRLRQNGVTQEVTAINFPASQTIHLNEVKWNLISSETLRKGIALHEVLSLLGIERTGVYTYSGIYFAQNTERTRSQSFLKYAADDHRQGIRGETFLIQSEVHAFITWSSERVSLCYVPGKKAQAMQYLEGVISDHLSPSGGFVEDLNGTLQVQFSFNYEDTESELIKNIPVCGNAASGN